MYLVSVPSGNSSGQTINGRSHNGRSHVRYVHEYINPQLYQLPLVGLADKQLLGMAWHQITVV
jgi:hypothetical protein